MDTQNTDDLEPVLFKYPDLVRLNSIPADTQPALEPASTRKRNPEIGIIGQIWSTRMENGQRVYKFVFKDEDEWRQTWLSAAHLEPADEAALNCRVERITD